MPGKDLKFNWKYIDTLNHITRLNLHRGIAIFQGQLHYAGYSKMAKYLVFSLIALKLKLSVFLTHKIFQKTEKKHNTGGKCCFCDRRHQQTNPGYLPTIIFWVALAKLVSKILLAYILFEALYKVHNFPSMTNSLKQY